VRERTQRERKGNRIKPWAAFGTAFIPAFAMGSGDTSDYGQCSMEMEVEEVRKYLVTLEY
jgi:hypothetical protein